MTAPRPHFTLLRDEDLHIVDLRETDPPIGAISEHWAREHEGRVAESENRKPYKFIHVVYGAAPYAVFDKLEVEGK